MSKLGVLYFNSGSPLYYGTDIGYDWCAYPTATLAVSFGEPFKIKFTNNSDEWIASRSHIIKKGVFRKILAVPKSSKIDRRCGSAQKVTKSDDAGEFGEYSVRSLLLNDFIHAPCAQIDEAGLRERFFTSEYCYLSADS